MKATTPPVQRQAHEWHPAQRIAFRWALLFFGMMLLPSVIAIFTESDLAHGVHDRFWRTVTPWIAKSVFGISREMTSFGSDSAFAVFRLLQQVIIAAIGAWIWTRLDTDARDYRRLNYWLRVAVRYTLASWMLSYGISKIFHIQFAYPDLTMLIRSFGELDSPMRLLWAFMGFSRPYQLFAGVIECTAVLLLFWNRTTTLGSLLAIGALTNVLILDWAYGVAVKMIVVWMLLCAGFLLAKDVPRLVRVLVRNLPTKPDDEYVPWRAWRWKRAGQAVKVALIAWILVSHVNWAMGQHPVSANVEEPPLYGSYRVERHVVDGLELTSNDSERWHMAAFDDRAKDTSLMAIRKLDETWLSDLVEYDGEGSRMTIGRGGSVGTLEISRPGPGAVELEGDFEGSRISLTLRRLPDPEFPLEKNASLRWIRFW